MRGTGRCFTHSEDPAIAARRTAGRISGGKHKRKYLIRSLHRPPVESIAEVRAIAIATFNGMLKGRIRIDDAVAILLGSYLCEATHRSLEADRIPPENNFHMPGYIKYKSPPPGTTDAEAGYGGPFVRFPLGVAPMLIDELAQNSRRRGVRTHPYLDMLRKYVERHLTAAGRRHETVSMRR